MDTFILKYLNYYFLLCKNTKKTKLIKTKVISAQFRCQILPFFYDIVRKSPL